MLFAGRSTGIGAASALPDPESRGALDQSDSEVTKNNVYMHCKHFENKRKQGLEFSEVTTESEAI